MSGYADVHSLNYNVWTNVGAGTSSIAPGTSVFLAFRAPSAVNGGGITVLSANAVSSLVMAVGSSPSVRLLRYSSSGTPAVEGTIAAAVGGTGTGGAWAAGVPKTFTIADGFVDANEYVAVELGMAGTDFGFRGGTLNDRLDVLLQYTMGY